MAVSRRSFLEMTAGGVVAAGAVTPGAALATPAATQGAAAANVLIDADRAFSGSIAEGGADAFAEWFAEDGVMVQPGVGEIRGREAVRSFVSYLDDPSLSFRWEPERADIAASGELGWTTGRYVAERRGADGTLTRDEGVYVSIWRSQSDGSWKVVMDLGNPLAPPGT